MSTREQKQKAGHYEILGESYAKLEFFEAGWNPYQRFLDIDKADFILRRRIGHYAYPVDATKKILAQCGAWPELNFPRT